MCDITFNVYFTDRDGNKEYLNENFYSEDTAQLAVEALIAQGFSDAKFEDVIFDLELP